MGKKQLANVARRSSASLARSGYKDDKRPMKLRSDDLQNASIFTLPPLLSSSEAPSCVRYPFISTGYRVKYSKRDCLYSIFTFHNETMNIWTHLLAFSALIGVVLLLIFDYYTCCSVDSNIRQASIYSKYRTIDFSMNLLYISCNAVAFLFSAIYHTFGCVSEFSHNCLLKLDLSGIIFIQFGSYFPILYYGFYCHTFWQNLYLYLSLLIIPVGGGCAYWGGGTSKTELIVRIAGFTFLGAMGIIPLIHWVFIAPDMFRNELATKGVAMYLPYAIGLFFFLTNLPERIWPQWSEKSRIVSHTIWHIGVSVGVCMWWSTLLTLQKMIRNLNENCIDWQFGI